MPFIPPQRLRAIRIVELRARLLRIRARERVVLLALLAEEEAQAQERRRRRPRSVWVKPWVARRPLLGTYDNLIQELIRESRGDFKSFMRMEVDMFQEMLARVGPRVAKQIVARQPLSPGLKIAVTLRYMATGESTRSLAFQFRLGHNSISLFIPQVCEAIRAEYQAEQMTTPSTPDAWLAVERKFASRWNWHHCCGALDGKHIRIVKPDHGGSNYYCHKGFHSLILLALVDADYKFLWVNVGAPGSESDCGVYNASNLEPALRQGTLGLPDDAPLPGDDRPTPYFLVGDDAFPLRRYMVKPYAQRWLDHDQQVFNYRCSRGRRVVENGFGILAGRWRCLHTPLAVHPDHAEAVVKAAVLLHNIMRDRYPNIQNAEIDVPEGQPGSWRDAGVLPDVEREAGVRGPRANREGKELRAYLRNYYNSPAGSVPWQEQAIRPHPAAN